MSVPVSVEPPPQQPRRRGFQTLRTQAAAVPRAWLPGAVGYACLLIGLLDIASAVFPKLRRTKMHSFAGQLPGGTTTLAAVGTLMVGLLLVLLAHAAQQFPVTGEIPRQEQGQQQPDGFDRLDRSQIHFRGAAGRS